MKNNPIRFIECLTRCLAALALLLATGCDRDDILKLSGSSRESFMQEKTPQRQESLARHCAELLRQGRYDDVVHMLQPSVVEAKTRRSLIAMHDILTEREPVSVKVIDAQKFDDGDADITDIVLDYEFPSVAKPTSGSTDPMRARWVFLTVGIRSANGAPDQINRINTVTSELPIEDINALTFENKGVSQYAAFATGILLSAFTIYAVVLCIRSKTVHRSLWILFMLFTVTFASVNWTSGEWSFNTISFGIAVPPDPANFSFNSAYGPWNLTLGMPIGAIAFVLYRKLRLGSGQPARR
jgi:hypothetical protein